MTSFRFILVVASISWVVGAQAETLNKKQQALIIQGVADARIAEQECGAVGAQAKATATLQYYGITTDVLMDIVAATKSEKEFSDTGRAKWCSAWKRGQDAAAVLRGEKSAR